MSEHKQENCIVVVCNCNLHLTG